MALVKAGPWQEEAGTGGGRPSFPPVHPCWRARGTHRKKLLPKTASAEPSWRHPEEALEEAVCPRPQDCTLEKGKFYGM